MVKGEQWWICFLCTNVSPGHGRPYSLSHDLSTAPDVGTPLTKLGGLAMQDLSDTV